MSNKRIWSYGGILLSILIQSACTVPHLVTKTENKAVPASYNGSQDSTNTGKKPWKEYFSDPYLTALIDSALYNNQELNITLQEIQIANNEVLARAGAYRPFVSLGGGPALTKCLAIRVRGLPMRFRR